MACLAPSCRKPRWRLRMRSGCLLQKGKRTPRALYIYIYTYVYRYRFLRDVRVFSREQLRIFDVRYFSLMGNHSYPQEKEPLILSFFLPHDVRVPKSRTIIAPYGLESRVGLFGWRWEPRGPPAIFGDNPQKHETRGWPDWR